MKDFNWKRKLAATLAAAGLLSPAAAQAANLNANLVLNPSFEIVDADTAGPCYFNGTVCSLLLAPGSGWEDYLGDEPDLEDPTGTRAPPIGVGLIDSYAYPYSSDFTGPGPAGSGDYYFTGGFSAAPGELQLLQTIDVSEGASGALINAGAAFYNLSAYFTTYRQGTEASVVSALFLNSGGAELGRAQVGGTPFVESLPIDPNSFGGQRVWGKDVSALAIPIGTTTVEMQISSEIGQYNFDGYVDLVDFQVTDVLRLPALDIDVDRDTGRITLSNRTGESVNIAGYVITSEIQGLDPNEWRSIADNFDADSGGSVDAVNVWNELTDSATFTDLSEADLESGLGATLDPDQTIDLGVGAWVRNPFADLRFSYVSDRQVFEGLVGYSGNEGAPFAIGDFNVDGAVDSADWMILRDHQHADLSSQRELAAYFLGDLNADFTNNHTDFVLFVNLFDQANGAGAFVEMIAELPEPGGIILAFTGGIVLLGTGRKDAAAT